MEKLGNGEGKDVDEEEVYKMSATLEKCNGLDAILTRFANHTCTVSKVQYTRTCTCVCTCMYCRLAYAKDFIQCHGLISAGLRLLGFCSKVKVSQLSPPPRLSSITGLPPSPSFSSLTPSPSPSPPIRLIVST